MLIIPYNFEEGIMESWSGDICKDFPSMQVKFNTDLKCGTIPDVILLLLFSSNITCTEDFRSFLLLAHAPPCHLTKYHICFGGANLILLI